MYGLYCLKYHIVNISEDGRTGKDGVSQPLDAGRLSFTKSAVEDE